MKYLKRLWYWVVVTPIFACAEAIDLWIKIAFGEFDNEPWKFWE